MPRLVASIGGAITAALLLTACGSPPPPSPPGLPTSSAPPAAGRGDRRRRGHRDGGGGAGQGAHPGLTWAQIPDVAPALKALYDGEADRLLWFDGTRPGAAARRRHHDHCDGAADHGLDPRTTTPRRWPRSGRRSRPTAESGPELALFDLAVSVAAARMATAVHKGRVDPATMLWGYDVTARTIDLVGALQVGPRRPRPGRRARSPPAAVPALSPGPPDGRHLSRPGAEGRAAGRARAGEERPQDRVRRRLGRGAATGRAAAHASAICRPTPRSARAIPRATAGPSSRR